MPTTRQIQSRLFPQSGMDSTSPPHLIEDGKWLLMQGMRAQKGYLRQIESLDLSPLTFPANVITQYDIVASPSGKQRTEQANCIFTDDGVYLMTSSITTVALKNKQTGVVFQCNQDGGNSSTPGRTIVTPYANQLWFTSPKTQLCSTDGASVISYKTQQDTATVSVPSPPLSSNFSAGIVSFNWSGVGTNQVFAFRINKNPAQQMVNGQIINISVTTAEYSQLTGQYVLYTTPRLISPGTFLLEVKTVDSRVIALPLSGPTLSGTASTVERPVQAITSPLLITVNLTTNYNNYYPGQVVQLSGLTHPNRLNSAFTIFEVLSSKSFTFYMPDLTRPSTLGQLVSVAPLDNAIVPSARFIENYYDHIIVANCTYNGSEEPWHVRWSNLYRPNDWKPQPESEADFYEVTSWQRSSPTINGITGMAKLRDVLYIYTDSCIVRCDYVGLPKVMQFRVVSENLGNFFYYGLVVTNSHHYFFDATEQDFYEFDGVNPPKAIGGPILGFFLDRITLNYRINSDSQYLRGQHRADTSEVSWSFRANDFRIIYNYDTKVWYTENDTTILGGGGNSFRLIDEQAVTINSISTEVNNYETDQTNSRIPTLVEAATFLYTMSSTSATRIAPHVQLDTKDFTVDLQRYVEVDRMTIHAAYDEVAPTESAYIQVRISARENIQDPIIYTTVGTWTQFNTSGTAPGGTMSFPAISGRIFRYRFLVGSSVHNLRFYSFSDNVFNITAEK